MTSLRITPFGSATITIAKLVAGWNRITDDIGVWCEPGVGVEFDTRRGGWYDAVLQFDGRAPLVLSGYLPPRAMVPIRPDSPAPTLGWLRPTGKREDWMDSGGRGIDACGTDGSIHLTDGVVHRHAVGLYDMRTGELRNPDKVAKNGYYRLTRGSEDGLGNKVTMLPEYSRRVTEDVHDDRRQPLDATPIPDTDAARALRAEVLRWVAINGEHLVRAYARAMRHTGDKLVRRYLRAVVCDVACAWDAERERAILNGPRGKGSGECGRDFAWSGYVVAIDERLSNPVGRWLGNLFGRTLSARFRRIARHVQHEETALLQRLAESWFKGNPHPWEIALKHGSGVAHGVDVAQDLEAYAQIVMLDALGMKAEALRLCRAVLTAPLMKWIGTDDGRGHGVHGAAHDQAWPAIAVWLRLDRRAALPCVTRWKVVISLTNWVGPFSMVELAQVALANSAEQGKTRWAAEELASEQRRAA